MIKLKSILKEVFEETRLNENRSGVFEYEIEFDGEEILTLARKGDIIDVIVDIEYSINSDGDIYIRDNEITNILIYSKNGQEREVDMDFLHPIPKRMIEDLVDNYIDKNSERIENEMRNKVEF